MLVLLLGETPMKTVHNAYHPRKLLHPYHRLRANMFLAGQIPPPSLVEIDPADKFCNQSCPECPFGSSVARANEFRKIDPHMLLAFLHQVYSEGGTLAYEWVGGGEPTTHPDLASMIKDLAGFNSLSESPHQGLVTNGVALDRVFRVAEHIEWCRVSLDAAFEEAYCAIHGVDARSGHHARVIRNLRTMVAQRGKDVVRIGALIVPPYNHDEKSIRAIVDLALDIGAKHVAFRPANLKRATDPKHWDEAHRVINQVKNEQPSGFILGGSWDYATKEKSHPRGPCIVRPLVLTIQADGTVPTCFLFRERAHERKPIGHIRQGFKPLWLSDAHQASIMAHDRRGCPTSCKLYRAQETLDTLRSDPGIASLTDADVDNPHFI